MTLVSSPGPLLLARNFRAEGGDPRKLRSAVEDGRLHRLRRGVYVATEVWVSASREEQALLHVRAFAATADKQPIFCHQSAALLHGLPLLRVPDSEVHVIGRSPSGGRRRDGVRRHQWSLGIPTQEQDGLVMTTRPRTVLDLSAALPFRQAVVAADAALRAGEDRDRLRRLADDTGYRAARRIEKVLGFASPLAESPGESVSRALFHQHGLPAPVLQQEFRDTAGFIGRVDFWWPQHGVIGEFDGRVKYGERFPGSPEERLWQEKLREDRLRQVSAAVVRWTWNHFTAPERLVDRLRLAGVRSLAATLGANRNALRLRIARAVADCTRGCDVSAGDRGYQETGSALPSS